MTLLLLDEPFSGSIAQDVLRDRPAERAGAGWGARALALLVAVLPLVVDPGGWFPYVSLRWAVMVGAAAVGLVTALASGRARGLLAVRPVRWWIALAVVVGLAVVAAPAWRAALVGAMDRRMGALTWWAHGALFLVAAIAVRRRADLRVLAHGTVVATLLVALVTALQQAGWDVPAHAVNRVRPGGPFGNADVLAAWCAVGVTVAVGVALDRRATLTWRMAAMSAAALGLATTAATGARGGWLGLAVGIGSLVAVGARRAGLDPRGRATLLAGSTLLLVAVLAVTGTLGRTLDVLDGTARGRVDTWVVAAGAVAERPVLGWGPDGLVEGLQHHVDDAYEQRYTRRLLPDRAHAAPLDVAGAVGLLGLAAWLGLLVSTGRAAVGAVRRDRSWTTLAVATGLAGLVVCELSLFPTFDVDAVAWVLAGALVGLGASSAVASVPSRRRAPRGASAVVGVGAVVVACALAVGGVLADRAARRSADALTLDRPVPALAAARAALRAEPGQPMPALLLAEAATATREPGTIDRAIGELEATRLRSADDGRLALAEGRLLEACAGRCERWRPHVRALADQLVARDPARSDGWRMVAALAEDRGDVAAAGAARHRVIDLAPGDDRPWRELARTLDRAGDHASAVRAAQRALLLDPTDDANLALLGELAPPAGN